MCHWHSALRLRADGNDAGGITLSDKEETQLPDDVARTDARRMRPWPCVAYTRLTGSLSREMDNTSARQGCRGFGDGAAPASHDNTQPFGAFGDAGGRLGDCKPDGDTVYPPLAHLLAASDAR